jgi:Ger(x)C family germination protein
LRTSETERNAIVTAVGIDKEYDNFKLSLLCFVPQANSNYAEKYEVVNCQGESVSNCLQKASIVLGKNVNLNHIESIVISEQSLKEDASHMLDYFARAPVVLTGCLISVTNNSAKEVIEIVNELNTKTGVKLENIMRFIDENYLNMETTIDSYYSGYYSPTSTSLLGYVEILESEEDGLEGDSQSSNQQGGGQENSGGQESSSTSQKKKVLSSTGKLALLKKGVFQEVLSSDDMRAINYSKTNNRKGLITLENSSFEGGEKEKVVYEIVRNKNYKNVSFENGIPIIRYKLYLRLDLFEAIDDNKNEEESINQYNINDETKIEIEKVVKRDFENLLAKMRRTKTDVLNIYELLQKTDRVKFNHFLKSLEDPEDFLSNVVFAISVESNPF